MSDLRPTFDAFLPAMGQAATLTMPDAEPIETTIIWLPAVPVLVDGVLAKTNDSQRVCAFPLSVVPINDDIREREFPRGSTFAAAEMDGGDVQTWRIESTLSRSADDIRVLVIPAPET